MAKQTEVCAEIKRETTAAFLISDDGETSSWVPKSQVKTDQDCGPGDTVVCKCGCESPKDSVSKQGAKRIWDRRRLASIENGKE